MLDIAFPLRAPHGRDLNTRGWLQEAALRCLLNNLDPEVAEDPENLIVYGGRGKAARDLGSLHAIVRTLERLADDETLLVQSGKPVGVFRTHELAPRVLIANSMLVPRWATLQDFWELEAEGLTMYGQMTAGSWIYIGTQGILQGTYETFAECARQHFGGTLEGRLVVTGGLGGMGGAQPLAATMNGAAFLGVDVDESRIRRRVDTGYCDRLETDLDRALRLVDDARRSRRPLSVGLVGNVSEVIPELVRRGARVNGRDHRGRTPLLAATWRNHVAVGRFLIQEGANVNAKDLIQDTPFLVAGAEGRAELLKLMLAAGADLKDTNRYGGTALIPAAHRGHVEAVKLLIATKIDKDHVNNYGWTALMEAVVLGDGGPAHTEIVRLLVQAGANARIPDRDGITPLEHARKRGYAEMVRILSATTR